MGHRGDPLTELLAALPEGDLERIGHAIAAGHRLSAARAAQRGDTKAAKFHSACAGDVLKRLREATT